MKVPTHTHSVLINTSCRVVSLYLYQHTTTRSSTNYVLFHSCCLSSSIHTVRYGTVRIADVWILAMKWDIDQHRIRLARILSIKKRDPYRCWMTWLSLLFLLDVLLCSCRPYIIDYLVCRSSSFLQWFGDNKYKWTEPNKTKQKQPPHSLQLYGVVTLSRLTPITFVSPEPTYITNTNAVL